MEKLKFLLILTKKSTLQTVTIISNSILIHVILCQIQKNQTYFC